ncbi:MAG: hypothetical protein HKL86_07000 [Acidimicrobiaceae bacterium]|nr:hypothetical protein [Acidimicrobiaceae bacterium]
MPIVRVAGLGPGDVELITARTKRLIEESPVVRLRTRIHPAAESLGDLASYDEWYESADSFEELYPAIVEDLVSLALESPNSEVLYVVPGSPVVAERTVELLRDRSDVTTICEPAVSVIDSVCSALGSDPMECGLRIVDALASTEALRGPGPLLVLQTYSQEVLATVADRLSPELAVKVLHHIGLADELIVETTARDLAKFSRADHLTSLWIDELRCAGEATDDLVALVTRLRRECPWDQEQTHGSLTRHLLEEAYEALDALEEFVRVDALGDEHERAARHVEEELGDLLVQIVFHAELADEEGLFNFAAIADAVRTKLIGRHPHVFGDVHVENAEEVARRWEVLKRVEKGRTSITDGIAWQLPSLTLYSKLLRKSALIDMAPADGDEARERAIAALSATHLGEQPVGDAESTTVAPRSWGDALCAMVECAQFAGIDLEGVLRERAIELRTHIQDVELRDRS